MREHELLSTSGTPTRGGQGKKRTENQSPIGKGGESHTSFGETKGDDRKREMQPKKLT